MRFEGLLERHERDELLQGEAPSQKRWKLAARHPVTHPLRRELSIMPEENMPPHTSRIIHLPFASRSGHHTRYAPFPVRGASRIRSSSASTPRRGGSHGATRRPMALHSGDRLGHLRSGAPGSACHFGEILPQGAISMMALSVSFSRNCAGAEPEVRIHLPPAESLVRTRPHGFGNLPPCQPRARTAGECGLRLRLPAVSVAIVSRQRDCSVRRRSPRRQSAATADRSST
jgi:hypothetical protein